MIHWAAVVSKFVPKIESILKWFGYEKSEHRKPEYRPDVIYDFEGNKGYENFMITIKPKSWSCRITKLKINDEDITEIESHNESNKRYPIPKTLEQGTSLKFQPKANGAPIRCEQRFSVFIQFYILTIEKELIWRVSAQSGEGAHTRPIWKRCDNEGLIIKK